MEMVLYPSMRLGGLSILILAPSALSWICGSYALPELARDGTWVRFGMGAAGVPGPTWHPVGNPPRSCICDSDQAFITLLTNSQEQLGKQEVSYNGSITSAGKRKISYYLQDCFIFTLFTLEIAWYGALGQSGSSQCSGRWIKLCHNAFLKGSFLEVGSFVGAVGGGNHFAPQLDVGCREMPHTWLRAGWKLSGP